jgi:hypothetical protein
MNRVIFSQKDVDEPKYGSEGDAYRAPGYYNPQSAEYKAYLFCPDGEPDKWYYVDVADLEPVPNTPGSPDFYSAN